MIRTLLALWFTLGSAWAQLPTLQSVGKPSTCSIGTISVSPTTFTYGAAANSFVGNITVSEPGCTLGGTLALGGTDAASFALSTTTIASSPSLQCPSGTTCPASGGPFSIDLTATYTGVASNSPHAQTGIAITGQAPFGTWNPSDKNAGVTLSNGNLTAAGSSGSWLGVRATGGGASTGKFYFEVTITSANNNGWMVGFLLSTASLSTYPGASSDGVGIQVIGTRGVGSSLGYNIISGGGTNAEGFTVGDVYGVAVDIGAQKIWITNVSSGVAGGTIYWNWEFSDLPEPTPVGAVKPLTATAGMSGNWYPAWNGQSSNSSTLNCGQNAFALPSGNQTALTGAGYVLRCPP